MGVAKLLLKLVISCVLLGLLLWRVPLGEIGSHLREFGPATLLLVLGFSLGCWVVAAGRLWLLLPEYRYRDLLHATFVAKFYSTVLPGQLAGDVVKAYRLGRQSSKSGHAEAVTALDRGLGLFALFLVSAVASLLSAQSPLPMRLFYFFGAAGVVVAGVVLGSRLFRMGVVERLLAHREGRMSTFVRDFSTAFQYHLRKPVVLISATALGLVFHAGCVAIQVLLGSGLGIALNLADWAVVYAGVSLLMMLPVSIAGLGLREGGYVGLLALFGYKASVALSLSFAILGATLAPALVGGVLELIAVMTHSRVTSNTPSRSVGR